MIDRPPAYGPATPIIAPRPWFSHIQPDTFIGQVFGNLSTPGKFGTPKTFDTVSIFSNILVVLTGRMNPHIMLINSFLFISLFIH